MSEIRSRWRNSLRMAGLIAAMRARQAWLMRSTSEKRASMSSVSL